MEEIQLVYGLKNEELVHIDQVESGGKCGCICPACHRALIARKGEVKRHHFASTCQGQNRKKIFTNFSKFLVKAILG